MISMDKGRKDLKVEILCLSFLENSKASVLENLESRRSMTANLDEQGEMLGRVNYM